MTVTKIAFALTLGAMTFAGCSTNERVDSPVAAVVTPTTSLGFTVRALPGTVPASPGFRGTVAASRNIPAALPISVLRHTHLAIATANPHSLGDAVLKIVRDPTAEFGLLVVVDRAQLNDRTLIVARHLLAADRRLVPTPTKERVISVFRDQRMQLQVGDSTFWSQGQVRLYGSSPSTQANAMTGALLARESSGRAIHIAGVGVARIVYDPADPLVGVPRQ